MSGLSHNDFRLFARDEKLVERFWSHVDKTATCWLWTASTFDKGHGQFRISKKWTVRAHRFAFWLMHPNEDISDQVIRHGPCRNRRCVRPDHLSYGSQSDNLADRALHEALDEIANWKRTQRLNSIAAYITTAEANAARIVEHFGVPI